MVDRSLEKYTNKMDYKTNKQVYREETNRLLKIFKQDLFEELEIIDNPKKDLLWGKAWNFGHSAGLNEILIYAYELVDLIE
jgi:hypothetical protein